MLAAIPMGLPAEAGGQASSSPRVAPMPTPRGEEDLTIVLNISGRRFETTTNTIMQSPLGGERRTRCCRWPIASADAQSNRSASHAAGVGVQALCDRRASVRPPASICSLAVMRSCSRSSSSFCTPASSGCLRECP